MEGPDGRVAHAEVRIGDSMIMLTDGSDQLQPSVTGLYLYVPDVDESYRRAIAAGGSSIQEPADQFYGDRNSGVKDPTGNDWWISSRIRGSDSG
jgi:PhnB protein